MKKQIILALAFSISAFSFAQKKELKLAEKAIKINNYAEAKTVLKQAEALMSTMDDKTKAKFYYLNGQALYANGVCSNADVKLALESFDNVEGAYVSEIATLKQSITNNFITKGNEAYEKKDFSIASGYFENAYRMSKKDTLFLYYAASASVNVKDYDRALVLYEELKELNFTGIQTQHSAVNKETGKEELFGSKTLRDISVKAKTHIKPTDVTLKSKKAEIVKNVALIYVNKGDNEKAITAIKEVREQNPDDVSLVLTEANVHYKMGHKEEFRSLLEKATEMDPTNAELQYNLGVITSESDDIESSKKYYLKAIELDPNFVNAYINMAALILNSEQALIEEMNGLGSSNKDNLRYDQLREERQNLYKTALPYLDSALGIEPENISAAKTLMNIYSILGETDKYKALKEKVEALEAGQ